MKRADHGELISLVYSLGLEDDCFFWSGIPGWQQELYELEPRLLRAGAAAQVFAAQLW